MRLLQKSVWSEAKKKEGGAESQKYRHFKGGQRNLRMSNRENRRTRGNTAF